jgi:hypothetical protein
MAAWREQSKRDTSRWDFENENHEHEHEDEDEGQPIYAEDTVETPDIDGEEEVGHKLTTAGLLAGKISLADAIGYRSLQ